MNAELQIVEQVIKGLNTPNNEERRKAEAQLQDLISKNKIGLVLCLCQILTEKDDQTLLTYCAVIAQKLVKVPEGESCNPDWKAASNEIKEQIKEKLISALLKCTNKSLKKN